jgi:excinuclease ABC subunit C
MAPRHPGKAIPTEPGVYQFFDDKNRVLYVGKARNLRSRLSSYFQAPDKLHPRTAAMVASADHVEWMVTTTEVEALVLENSLINGLQPRFNVRLKDDKSYPWLAIGTKEPWPRPQVTRGARRKGVRYFGPFVHARSLRQTVDLLLPIFPVRSCPDSKFKRHERSGRPCLLADIDRCSAPCVGRVSEAEYESLVQGFVRFFSGEVAPIRKSLEISMSTAASERNYERAAKFRDQLEAIDHAAQAQQVVLSQREFLDVIGLASDDLQLAMAVVHIRHGRIVGQNLSVADLVEDLDPEALIATVLRDVYGKAAVDVPSIIALRVVPREHDAVGTWLSEQRNGPVSFVVPQRGARLAMMELAERSARDELKRDSMRRSVDHNARSKALLEIQEALGLERPPFRIECFDMSHLQGRSYVGSMVVFEDGLPLKSAYRHFAIKTVPGNDDFAAMAEVLRRRMLRFDDEDERGRRFGARADLLLIDGGLGQLSAVTTVLDELNKADAVEVASLAKRFEEVYRPGSSVPIRLPRGSEALFLLQRVRDEAHRFAISYHRSKRAKAVFATGLEGIKGLGPARINRLLGAFGTLEKIKTASLEEISAQSGISQELARSVAEALSLREAESVDG